MQCVLTCVSVCLLICQHFVDVLSQSLEEATASLQVERSDMADAMTDAEARIQAGRVEENISSLCSICDCVQGTEREREMMIMMKVECMNADFQPADLKLLLRGLLSRIPEVKLQASHACGVLCENGKGLLILHTRLPSVL